MSTGRKRSSVVSVKPGEASEDGDYVAVREARLRRPPRAVPFQETDEEDERTRPVKLEEIVLKVTSRKAILDAVQSDSESNLKTVLGSTELNDSSLTDPVSRRNLLHVALDSDKFVIAEYIIGNAPEETLIAEFDVFCGGIHAKKHALHQITWLQNIHLASSLLRRINGRRQQQRFIKQETAVEITGQRPRTFSCLHMAAFLGCTDLVELFLGHDIDCDLSNARNDTPLLWAARWGHVDTVNLLLDRKADPSLKNDKGSTALYWAVRYGHHITVNKLIEKGHADVNQTRKLGLVAPIVLASALGDAESVTLLLDNGAHPNQSIRGQETPLHHAAREGHVEVAEILLKRGAHIDAHDDRGDTPIIEAALQDNVAMVDFLLRKGANLVHQNHEGVDVWAAAIESPGDHALKVLMRHASKKKALKPALCIAASVGSADKIHTLLNLGADPKITDDEGNSFIHCACANNYPDIIHKYHKDVDINSKNRDGNTPLHIACFHGHHNSVEALSIAKAKADIKNNNQHTALHVAAKCKAIRPETVKLLIEHVIRTHAWMSLHTTDDQGQNALHVAGQYATPDVMWEFRFVRLKDQDMDGQTPLHDAVRPGAPESIDCMLDIYETVKRDADINTQTNIKLSVLHMAAMEGYGDVICRLVIYGADLSLQDINGNTVLHLLVQATVSDQKNAGRHLRTFNAVLNEAVRWHCLKNQLQYPDNNGEVFTAYRREAILYLTDDIINSDYMSVMAFAFRLGAKEVLETLLTMNLVTKFPEEDNVWFDITGVMPTTNPSSSIRCCGNNESNTSQSCLKLLVQSENKQKASEVLDIAPMKEIEQMYESVCAYTFLVLMIFHIAYMICFTYVGSELQGKVRRNETHELDAQRAMMYAIVPLEPAIILFYSAYAMYRKMTSSDSSRMNFELSLPGVVWGLMNVLWRLFPVIYAGLVITWIILYEVEYKYQDYFLAVDLLVGWLASIGFTRGFKSINCFWRMLQHIIVRDIYRFLIVYCFVLLGFSFAFHVIFQLSSDISEKYRSPGDTIFLVFNLMIGMGEIFDDEFAQGMADIGRNTAFVKVIYLLYMVFGAIIMLNLLIAMMSDSYSHILAEHQVSWRLDAVRLGISIENMFPCLSRLLTSVKLRRGDSAAKVTWDEHDRWFIGIDNQILKTRKIVEVEREDTMSMLSPRIESIERKVDLMKEMLDEKLRH